MRQSYTRSFKTTIISWFHLVTLVTGLSSLTLTLWILILVPFIIRYRYRIAIPINNAAKELRNVEEEIQRRRLSTNQGRLQYLREEVTRLTSVTARVLLENEYAFQKATAWREECERRLAQLESINDDPSVGVINGQPMRERINVDLGEVQSLVSSIKELILKEETDLRSQRNWRYFAIFIIIVYIAVLTSISVFTDANNSNRPIPVFGIPLSVATWGAAGSLGAILYRFYTETKRVRFDLELRWLIARPVVGIIMGAVVYLALSSGLILLGTTPPGNGSTSAVFQSTTHPEIFWVIAFVAGFSDKFYLSIINLLVERTVGEKSNRLDGTARSVDQSQNANK